MVEYKRRIVVFSDGIIQRYFEHYLREKMGVKDIYAWRVGYGEAKYEKLRNQFLRERVYPTTIKKVTRTRKKA